MNAITLAQKLQQFEEFFSIDHNFTVNLTTVDKSTINSFDDFVDTMPLPFKMASDMTTVDQSALRPLQSVAGVASQLAEFLNHQAHKIDLLVGYILSQQDDESMRYQGIKMGGGGIVFASNTPFNVGDFIELKIFLLAENCAVFCLGEIVEVTEKNDTPNFHQKVIFHYIRDEDQETLVRLSLHEQSKQLQKLAQARKKR